MLKVTITGDISNINTISQSQKRHKEWKYLSNMGREPTEEAENKTKSSKLTPRNLSI